MKNVIVYRDGVVVADGVKLDDVRSIEVSDYVNKKAVTTPLIKVEVTGTITFSQSDYEPITRLTAIEARMPDNATVVRGSSALAPPTPHPDTLRVMHLKKAIDHLHHIAKISTETKNDLLTALL